MTTEKKVRTLLDNMQIAYDKRELLLFNELSNQVHEISDGIGLTSAEYDEWACLRDKVLQIELEQFLDKWK